MSLISEEVYRCLESDPNLTRDYNNAAPYPHKIFDNLFNHNSLFELMKEFPSPSDGKWWKYENVLERKLARNDLHNLPWSIQCLIHELQSYRFVSFLEGLTGIRGLITDHTLNGGGLHQIIRGGKLDIHADYNFHPITKLDRRINVLVYLNNGWKPEWKGNLELWDKDMTKCVQSVMPIFNRTVVFNVTDDALHGHPDSLECPDTESRKSIALYYYTNGRPDHERSTPHSTVFKRRPEDPIIQEHEQLRKKRAMRRLT